VICARTLKSFGDFDMATNFVQDGDVLEYTAGADTVSGQVVRVGQTLGVALADIANGATGPVKITGVFTVPKVSAAVIAQGERLVWDASAAAFDDNAASPATGDVSGESAIAFEAAGNGVTSFKVRFTGAPGTVT
jgi:predicted RecA/RadA family phage recombinase